MASSFLDAIADFIGEHALLPQGARVVVAASGGADSMACLSGLRRLGYDVHAFHVNYGLREGAEADEALVRRWCARQSPPVPCEGVACDASARAAARDESLQEAARDLRYAALADHATALGATAVATGHHRDDQAETLLLNLVRGCGPEGLAGMRPARPLQHAPAVSLVRPLLPLRRDDIEAYAAATGLPWRTDPTNRSLAYDRAVIRTEILPRLAAHFEGARAPLARSARLVREYVDADLRPALRERMATAFEEREEGGWLHLQPLRTAAPVWRRRLVLAALRRSLPAAPSSHGVASELAALVEAQVGRRVEVDGGAVWRERGGLRFLPAAAAPDALALTPVPPDTPVDIPQGTLRVEPVEEAPDALDAEAPYIVYADADRLGTALAVRTWDDGDRFCPLGLEGTKRVSRLLTDQRVPAHRRTGIAVLCTDAHIAWVVGHRLDHRVRVRPDTEHVVRLVLQPREKA
jgi:tRNA(Ile)-lysidine synthase